MRMRGALGLALMWLLLVTGHAPTQEKVDKALRDIERAWKAREDKVKSARFAWVEKQAVAKGRVTKYLTGARGEIARKEMGIPKDAVAPPQDTVIEATVTLSLDGQKLRLHRMGKEWDGKAGAYVDCPSLTTFDGQLGKRLREKGLPYLPSPSGIIRKEKRPDEGGVLHYAPVLMTLRPVMPGIRSWSLEDFEVAKQAVLVRGRRCVELQQRTSTGWRRIAVDPGRDYVIVRRVDTDKDKTLLNLEITYRPDGQVGWVPEAWSFATRDRDGGAGDSVRASVTSHAINPGLEPALFDIEFPPRTRVRDMRQKPMRVFIVREGGGTREVEDKELALPTDTILATDPHNEASLKGRYITGPLILACLLATLFGAVFVWRRFRKKAPPPTNTGA